jgi:hypothetical protein
VSLRVLITNIELWPPSGTVIYVRDLALELKRQGHRPAVFSSTAGDIADELRSAGVPVANRLDQLPGPPDVIHGHHHAPTMVALRHWPLTPAIYVSHDHTSPNDRAPLHHHVYRHFGVSRICLQRLISDGVPEYQVASLPNFVDTVRFSPRSPLPKSPRRALVFSNYARADGYLPAVIEACREAGVELDVAGRGVGRTVMKPEGLLPEYDIVFAKAKAAMEAMAVGAATILCDFGGVGPMVRSEQFETLRSLNFGFEALRSPIQPESLLREMARYDAEDAARVRDLIRARASLRGAAEGLVAIYHEVMARHQAVLPVESSLQSRRWSIRNSLYLRLYWAWMSLPSTRRDDLRRRLPALAVIKRGGRWLLGQA